MPPIRKTTRRTTRTKKVIDRPYTKLELEIGKNLNILLTKISELISVQTLRASAQATVCQRCYLTELERCGFCAKCFAEIEMQRRIAARMMPQVKTVGGMAKLGQDWIMEQ